MDYKYLYEQKLKQTAALREELTIAISLLQGFPIAEPGDFSIGGKHHEWYCRRCDFLENNGVLGTGVIKQTNEKDARIMELEGLLSGAQNIYTSAIKGRSDFRKAYVETLRSLKDKDTRIAELEKSRDMYMRECSKHLNAIISLKRVTDEAVKLLGKANDLIEGDLYNFLSREERAVSMDIRQGLERLSCGETKPASPWISVEDRLPEEGQSVAFVVASTVDEHNNGRVLGGRYDGFKFRYHGFSTPGVGWAGSYWMPLPAPPESLTDKTE